MIMAHSLLLASISVCYMLMGPHNYSRQGVNCTPRVRTYGLHVVKLKPRLFSTVLVDQIKSQMIHKLSNITYDIKHMWFKYHKMSRSSSCVDHMWPI